MAGGKHPLLIHQRAGAVAEVAYPAHLESGDGLGLGVIGGGFAVLKGAGGGRQ